MKQLFNLQYLISFILLAMTQLSAQPHRIVTDGEYEDWQSVPVAHTDPAGDQNSGNLDFGRLWITNDEFSLLIRLEVGEEINLQDFNSVTLYIDTDNNVGSGLGIGGIGADFQWTFGQRSGTFRPGGSTINIFQNDIGVVTAPTVTDDEFEISLKRDARPNGSDLLFPGNTIRIYVRDNGSGGDRLPNSNGGISYTFTDTPLPDLVAPAIAQKDPQAIRFLSYNVLSDGLFDNGRLPSFIRLLQAIQPTIIGFQEIYGYNAQEVTDQVESILGGQWYGAKRGPDNLAISRYPILSSYQIDGNGAFLIDLRPDFDTDLLFLVAHTPCCANNNGRQMEIDAMMAFVRDAKVAGGVLSLDPETPIVICGDMNLVGDAQQLNTLLTGDIVNTGSYGPSFSPDWDGSDLSDLFARHTDLPQVFTWYSENSSFSPGRLDFMVYSDAVMTAVQQFVLFTPALPLDTLIQYGIAANDAIDASDHLPVVGDFRLNNFTAISDGENLPPVDFELAQNYPNPFNPTTNIRFRMAESGFVTLKVFDALGKQVRLLLNDRRNIGTHMVTWDALKDDGGEAASGIYYYTLQVGEQQLTRKMLLLR